MLIITLYTLLALFSTLLGSITGMGGGVIMKPVMDALGHFDTATVGLLSSTAIFAMAIMSCIRQRNTERKVRPVNLILLGGGSATGGVLGQLLFEYIKAGVQNDALVKLIQNAILAGLIAVIFFYVIFSDKIKKLELKHFAFYIVTGLFLGVVSSFLGIGGGPINVAVLMFLFSMDIKTASFSSIITILFSQFTKLLTVLIGEWAADTWFAAYDLTVLPWMVAAALLGAFTGSLIKNKINQKVVVICFNAMQLMILTVCIYNIIS